MIWPTTKRLHNVTKDYTGKVLHDRLGPFGSVRECSSVCLTVDDRRVVAGIDGGVKLQSAAAHPVLNSVATQEVVAEKQFVTVQNWHEANQSAH